MVPPIKNLTLTIMRKTKAEAEKTREQLLQSALDTFFQHGVSKTSLHMIAQNAGVTRGALYWHFKNKEDLFKALIQHGFQNFQTLFAEQNGSSNSLRQILLEPFDRLQHNEQQRKICIILNTKCEHTEENSAIVALHLHYIGLWEQHFCQLLKKCTANGELPPELHHERAAQYLYMVICGIIQMWQHKPQINLDETVPPLIDAAVFTLQHSPPI
ncbi:MAG: TetR family transcriptional regulator [Neisseria sp.]|nr:TetR family transcriptional regulator [Neisseria sp.]